MTENTTLLTVSAIPLTLDSHLLLQFWNAARQAVDVVVRSRIMLPDGTIVPSTDVHTVPVDTAENEFRLQLTKGQLISCHVETFVDGIQRGMLFCKVYLQEGTFHNSNELYQLHSGYISRSRALLFPNTEPEDCLSGTGAIMEFQTDADGSAGENFYGLPAWTRQRVMGGTITYATSAAVANRVMAFQMLSNANYGPRYVATAQQAASLTKVYKITGAQIAPPAAQADIQLPVDSSIWTRGTQIWTYADNLQAGDLVMEAIYILEQLIDIHD